MLVHVSLICSSKTDILVSCISCFLSFYYFLAYPSRLRTHAAVNCCVFVKNDLSWGVLHNNYKRTVDNSAKYISVRLASYCTFTTQILFFGYMVIHGDCPKLETYCQTQDAYKLKMLQMRNNAGAVSNSSMGMLFVQRLRSKPWTYKSKFILSFIHSFCIQFSRLLIG